MPVIKPVSDLRNYGEVLRDVAVDQPVFLTKNGYGRYVIMDLTQYQELERQLAMNKLMMELDKGRRSGEEKGWIPAEDVFKKLEECSSGKEKSWHTLEEVERQLGVLDETR